MFFQELHSSEDQITWNDEFKGEMFFLQGTASFKSEDIKSD